MNFAALFATFALIGVGELPDKTMFASVVLSTRAKGRYVWVGAAGAFLVHVTIAVAAGAVLMHLLPGRVVDLAAGVMFLGGALFSLKAAASHEEELVSVEMSRHGAIVSSFAVIFVAEWGDLTQILTASLAARYHSPISVEIGAVAALWTVAAIAVIGGKALMSVMNVKVLFMVTTAVLVLMATWSLSMALR